MLMRPFRGVLPRPEAAEAVVSPPYDVLSDEEARALAADSPVRFVRVIRPEVQRPPGAELSADQRHSLARSAWEALRRDGVLQQDPEPAYYVYRIVSADHRQTGIVGAASLDDYASGKIARHEHTRPDKEQDRARLMERVQAQTGVVLLTHRPVEALRALLEDLASAPPDLEAASPSDGTRHQLWRVTDPKVRNRLQSLLAALPRAYIADGHHRAAAAARVAATHREAGEVHSGFEPFLYFLVALFPSDELRILPYDRVIRDLRGLDAGALVEALQRQGIHVERETDPVRSGDHRRAAMGLREGWFTLTFPEEPGLSPTEALGARRLERWVLEPILGIHDVRTDPRVDFVGGVDSIPELQRGLASGAWEAAFALPPVSVDTLLQVADMQAVMPPKSTWFDPKLLSGLVSLSLEGETL